MTVFINGGAPTQAGDAYPGAIVTSTSQVLITIRDALTNNSHTTPWMVVDDSITTNGTLEIKGNGSNNNKIQALFKARVGRNISQQANASVTLQVRPLDPTTGAITDAPYSDENTALGIQIEEGQNNKLFITCDEDSIVMCSIPTIGNSTGVFAGYLDRLDETDSTAIYIGLPCMWGDRMDLPNPETTSGRENAYEFTLHLPINPGSRGYANNRWYNMYQGYSPTANPGTSSIVDSPLMTVADFMVRSMYTTSSTITNVAAFENIFYGSINGLNSKPILSDYYLLEGKLGGSGLFGDWITDPGTYQRDEVIYRGKVKNLVTGLCSYNKGEQWQSSTGEVYLSTGNPGWQGMRIA